jgi:hypothetical protein
MKKEEVLKQVKQYINQQITFSELFKSIIF